MFVSNWYDENARFLHVSNYFVSVKVRDAILPSGPNTTVKTMELPRDQWRRKINNWGGGGGGHIHILFKDFKNNRSQKKLIMQNTNI